jgi:hypothetical protein
MQFTFKDIKDKEYLKKLVKEETNRIFNSESARQDRNLDQVKRHVLQGKIAELYLAENIEGYKICTWDIYHDIYDEINDEYIEVKAYTDAFDILEPRIQYQVKRITEGRNWNKSKLMYVFSFNEFNYTLLGKINLLDGFSNNRR